MNYTALMTKACQTMKGSEIGELLAVTRSEGFISLAAGVPAKEVYPVEKIAMAAKKLLEKRGREVLQYGDPLGDYALREQITAQILPSYGITVMPEQIQLTAGSMQGLDLCARLFLAEGDIALVESPTFIDAMNTLGFTGARVEGIPCDAEGMALEPLRARLDEGQVKIIYVIPDYQNPTGRCWSQARRRAFMQLVQQYEVIVLEDNPYGEIVYDGVPQTALKHYDTKGQVIFLGSFSKTFSPGLRIGWLAADKRLIEALNMVKERSDIHSSIPDQALVATFMEEYSYRDHVTAMSNLYKNRLNTLVTALQTALPEFTFQVPQGGFFLWVRLPQGVDCMAFFEAALAKKVAVVPGQAFFPAKDNTAYIRLNFTGIDEMQLQEAVQRMAQAYHALKANI